MIAHDTVTASSLESAQDVIYRHMGPTPQYCWPMISSLLGTETWVKHENHTPIGAFKVRGGLVFMEQLKQETPNQCGVITATRGNHGQSVGFAARAHGIEATILVPHGNNPEKNAAMEALGVELIEHGHDFQAAREKAQELAGQRDLVFLPPINEPIVNGVATYAYEFFTTVEDCDVVYVPIGQGSGICGVIAVRDLLGLKTRIVGVVAEEAPCYALSFEKGECVNTETANTIADGMACRQPIQSAVDVIRRGAERIVRVSETEVLEAIRIFYTHTHNLAEGAGAAPLAAALKERGQLRGQRVGVILTGGNIDRATIIHALS